MVYTLTTPPSLHVDVLTQFIAKVLCIKIQLLTSTIRNLLNILSDNYNLRIYKKKLSRVLTNSRVNSHVNTTINLTSTINTCLVPDGEPPVRQGRTGSPR